MNTKNKIDIPVEASFQKRLIKEIKNRLPGSIVTKLDPRLIQGIPDLLILFGDRWALLEVKRSEKESHRPNQDYYVEKTNQMSFARFIFPENKEVVLDEMESALRAKR